MNNKSYAYNLIKNYYGNETAKRSCVPLINHIDEGIYILNKLGASKATIDAYCLHPIFQSDDAIKEAFQNLKNGTFDISQEALALALEYRSKANAYLSFHERTKDREPNPGPLVEVKQMLIADKIQNRKDFEKYHKGKHERSDRLSEYFREWLDVLEVSEEDYENMVQELNDAFLST